MENKINIAELLKDCPKGMELDCTMYNKITLISVDDRENAIFPIVVLRSDGCKIVLTQYGQYAYMDDAKCVIFPKGKTTWDGFVPPCKFKDGDIVATNDGNWVGITTGGVPEKSIPTYCVIGHNEFEVYLDKKKAWRFNRLATYEEKQKLFQAIKDNGYYWNAETKTLEKLIEPKFKVGDKIEKLGYRFTIIQVKDNNYLTKCGNKIPIDNQDDFILVPNKFDITTLKPFKDKVLARDDGYSLWQPCLWGLYDKGHKFPYVTLGSRYRYCIPYEGNEHLLGKTKNCDEYYKTWE